MEGICEEEDGEEEDAIDAGAQRERVRPLWALSAE
jgi:hypothetical protein